MIPLPSGVHVLHTEEHMIQTVFELFKGSTSFPKQLRQIPLLR